MILATSHRVRLLSLPAVLGGLLLVLALLPAAGAGDVEPEKEESAQPLKDPAIAAGLKWLALHQAQAGHWSLHEFNKHAREKPFPAGQNFPCNCTGVSGRRDDVAATAFALLPFLAAGITHKPAQDAPAEYAKTVNGGLIFLLSKQGKDGYFGGGAYSHAIASLAVCNAYGLTSDPVLKVSAQRCINYVVAAQDPNGGGWRYTPGAAGDTSVTGWEMQALKSAQIAGLNVPAVCLKKAEKFLDAVETQVKGGYSYTPGSGETPPMTAAGNLCRTYLGAAPRNPSLLAGIDRLQANPPGTTRNLYYEYYATQLMHQVGGEKGEEWMKGTENKPGMRAVLLKQVDAGNAKTDHQKGSWAPTPGGQVTEGGRIMATSLSLLMLEMPLEKLPLFKRGKE